MKCKNTKIIWNEAILVRLLISFYHIEFECAQLTLNKRQQALKTIIAIS